jgi:putative transcriptional regulator
MAIIINIDVMLAKRKMSVTELAEKVGITMANISVLKNGKAKAIRLSTLEAICKALECQPGDILEYHADLESKAKISAYFFTSHLDNWAQNNPNLTREEFTNTPELISALREQASKKRISEYSYNRFLDDWRNAGVDVTKLN